MNDPPKPELTLAQIREIMDAENIPTGRLFVNNNATMNNQAEEKQLTTINPAQLMQISTDVAAVCGEIVKKRLVTLCRCPVDNKWDDSDQQSFSTFFT